MTLYLQVEIGCGTCLLDAAHVLELRRHRRDGDPISWQGEPVRAVDLRELFAERAGGPSGRSILYSQTSGETAALLVDRIAGTVELDAVEFCPLPPIGPLGLLIDAVTAQPADRRPMLRLRGERVLANPIDRGAAEDR